MAGNGQFLWPGWERDHPACQGHFLHFEGAKEQPAALSKPPFVLGTLHFVASDTDEIQPPCLARFRCVPWAGEFLGGSRQAGGSCPLPVPVLRLTSGGQKLIFGRNKVLLLYIILIHIVTYPLCKDYYKRSYPWRHEPASSTVDTGSATK